MKKLVIAISLFAMISITVSCSKDDDDVNISNNSKETSEQGEEGEKDDNGVVYNVGQYEYYGTWKINDSAVEADDFSWLWYEYWSQMPDSYIDPYNLSDESISISFSTIDDPYVSYLGFPIKSLVHLFFPEADIAHVVYATQIGGLYIDKWAVMNKITDQYRKDGDKGASSAFLLSWLNPTGYSEKALYYELKGSDASAYAHFTIVVTTKDDDYFGLSFNIVPHKSLLVYDCQTEMITLSLCMPSIDIIDKDYTRITKQLDSEFTITFTSNKIIRHYVGNRGAVA